VSRPGRPSAALVQAIQRAGVRDPRILDAFRRVARERFVPAERAALRVEALELSGGERVLEIGTGLGYQAAILGALARTVYSTPSASPATRPMMRSSWRPPRRPCRPPWPSSWPREAGWCSRWARAETSTS
jgi:hypothetical protein